MAVDRDDLEKQIIEKTADEGAGSVYERIMLKRFFQQLCEQYDFENILEMGASITKGYDNVIFLKNQKQVSVFDENINDIREQWKFEEIPEFVNEANNNYDLVWNFALLQLDPTQIDQVIEKSRKYVLIFTPNFYNWGTPWHVAYHLFTGTKCKHAERGKLSLRTRSGLKKYLESKGVKEIQNNYIDIPPIPDIGFSIKELKETVFKKQYEEGEVDSPINPKDMSSALEKWTFIEKRKWLKPIYPFIAHHNYFLGMKK